MKTLERRPFPLRGIGVTAVLLLLAQSALAVGTDEDTDINNMATVNYDVGGVGQQVIESDPAGNSVPGAGQGSFTTFQVDRKIDFELLGPGANTIIVPNETDAVLTFTLTNSGNDHQDFGFAVTNQGGDDFDMNETTSTLRIFVDGNANGVYDAGVDTATFVDELAPDGATTATIFVVADADDPTPINGWLATLELVVNAHDGNDGVTGGPIGALATDHSGVADDPAVVQNVFAELGNVNYDNAFEALGTYEVQSAALNVTKTSAVISDPFSTAPNWKAIPGAVVEYTLTIENTGATTAGNVSVSDTIDIANVTFNTGQYANGDADITVNALDVIAPGTCVADGDATDGCTYDAGTGAVVLGIAAPGVSIPAGQTAVFTYQVTIN
jgi:uncharacterized repeat protein (TIGR01451 family)